MRNHRAAFAVTAAVLTGFAGTAAAADSQNLNLTANVLEVCKFQGTAKTVTFGDLNPSTTTSETAGTLSAGVAYKCTKGTVISTITVGDGNNYGDGSRRLSNGTDYIKYSLAVTAPTAGDGFGAASNDKAMVVDAKIQLTDYQDVPAGTYTDTVQLDITP